MRRSLVSAFLMTLGWSASSLFAQYQQPVLRSVPSGTPSVTAAGTTAHTTRNNSFAPQAGGAMRPNTVGVSTTLSDTSLIQEVAPTPAPVAAQQDVPSAPATGDAQQQVGPGLQVQSNAATAPDWAYERGRFGRFMQCDQSEPFRLFGTTARGTEVGGWLMSGWHTDDNGLFNNDDDRLRLHQGWIYAENKADQCCNWDVGYRFDLVYGVDGLDLQAKGNSPAGAPEDWDNDFDHGIYGWAVPQAYAEFARGRHSILAGKFFSPLGYESLMGPQSFFYSHSFSRFFTQPFTLSGVLSRFDYTNDLQLLNGVTAGWDTGYDQTNGGATYVGGFRYHPCAPINFSYLVSAGNTGYLGEGWNHNFITDVMLTDRMNYVVETNILNLDNNDDFSVVNYLLYRVNPCIGVGTRFEWYRSDRFTGVDNSTYSWTSGLNVNTIPNLIWRPEVRVDWGAGAVDPGQLILGSSLIVQF